MEKILERFLKYVAFDTQSHEDSKSSPSTEKQKNLSSFLKDELSKMGLEAFTDEYGYVYSRIPANVEKDVSKIGFIAHIDTSPEVPGAFVKPRVIEKYGGEEIVLSEKIVLSPKIYPHLLQYIGDDLVVTDGTTLLGSDDKAGIAEIIQAAEEIIAENEPHGDIFIAFTTDEEVGRGTDHFNFNFFKANFAFTVDGEGCGIFEYENFNAVSAHFRIHGRNTHPGSAKGTMKNSISIACEIMLLFPRCEIPEATENREGFFHFYEILGGVQDTFIKAIIRDHDKERFENRKEFCKFVERFINEKYGEGTLEIELSDSYYNMKDIIEKHPDVLDIARKAFEKAGIDFVTRPIRGGTDGARLTYAGLPTPNIFSGGQNLHSVLEYVSVQSMIKSKEVIKNIVRIIGEKD